MAVDLGEVRLAIGKESAVIEYWCVKGISSESLKQRKNMKQKEFNQVSNLKALHQREKGNLSQNLYCRRKL